MLVLSSSSPVSWTIEKDDGATIEKIYLTGHSNLSKLEYSASYDVSSCFIEDDCEGAFVMYHNDSAQPYVFNEKRKKCTKDPYVIRTNDYNPGLQSIYKLTGQTAVSYQTSRRNQKDLSIKNKTRGDFLPRYYFEGSCYYDINDRLTRYTRKRRKSRR